MLIKPRLILLVVLSLNIISLETVWAQTSASGDPAVEKVKKQVAKRGTGTKARVKVHLIDGSTIHGYINQIRSESFTVIRTDQGYVGVAGTIAYDEVTKLEGKGASRDTSVGPPKSSTVIKTILEGIFVFLRGS